MNTAKYFYIYIRDMAGFCTNLDLFVKLRSGGDLKNFMFLYESIISVLNTEVSEEDKNLIKEFCRLFCVYLNKKWIESSRNQTTFMNRVSNRKLLKKTINWPVCDSVDLRSEMGFSDAALSEPVDTDSHVPTLAVCTAEAGTSTEKEHRKPFDELSNNQKKTFYFHSKRKFRGRVAALALNKIERQRQNESGKSGRIPFQ